MRAKARLHTPYCSASEHTLCLCQLIFPGSRSQPTCPRKALSSRENLMISLPGFPAFSPGGNIPLRALRGSPKIEVNPDRPPPGPCPPEGVPSWLAGGSSGPVGLGVRVGPGFLGARSQRPPCSPSAAPQSTPPCAAWGPCTGARASWKPRAHTEDCASRSRKQVGQQTQGVWARARVARCVIQLGALAHLTCPAPCSGPGPRKARPRWWSS